MKTKFVLFALVGSLATACDFYKDDVPAVVNYTMDYIPAQPIAVDLGAFIEHGKSKSFKLSGLPREGSAEILHDSFLIYEPTGNQSDHIVVDIFNERGEKIGEAQVNLEANGGTCGIAKFDYAEVPSGGELQVDLTENDQFCGPIREAVLMYTPIENAEGMSVNIPVKIDPTDPNEKIKIQLSYVAPAGFTGVAKGLYVAGVNLKEEYRDQWGTDELMIDPAEKFEYFVASLVEVKVQ